MTASRKKQAWARAKHKLMKGLSGDVWSHKRRKTKDDSSPGWEDSDIDEGEEEELMARYSQKAIFALNLCVLVYRWCMGAHPFAYGLVCFPLLQCCATCWVPVGFLLGSVGAAIVCVLVIVERERESFKKSSRNIVPIERHIVYGHY